MATATKAIDSEVLEILKGATVDGLHLKLNCPQLDRALYGKVADVLKRMGGKWKGGKVAAFVFDRDPSPLLADSLGSGKKPAKNPLNYFPTPEAVVRKMLDAAEIPASRTSPLLHILEPSAGEGAIAGFVSENRRNVAFTCVELDPVRAERLQGTGYYQVIAGDFLEVPGFAKGRTFDYVLMNPPFECPSDPNIYVDHVLHAFGFLKPGGRLVAICPSGFTFNQNRKLVNFLEWVGGHGEWHALHSNAFRESGTGVNTCMVVVDKPV